MEASHRSAPEDRDKVSGFWLRLLDTSQTASDGFVQRGTFCWHMSGTGERLSRIDFQHGTEAARPRRQCRFRRCLWREICAMIVQSAATGEAMSASRHQRNCHAGSRTELRRSALAGNLFHDTAQLMPSPIGIDWFRPSIDALLWCANATKLHPYKQSGSNRSGHIKIGNRCLSWFGNENGVCLIRQHESITIAVAKLVRHNAAKN